MSDTNKPTIVFWIIAVIALLWNLTGLYSFFIEVFISQDALANMPSEERELYQNTPGWIKVVFGIATISGTAGSVYLLLRRKISYNLFVLSVIAALIQMVYSAAATEAIKVFGIVAIIMPIIVIGFGVFLAWYSKACIIKGWLK